MKRAGTALVLIPLVVWTVLFSPAWAFLALCSLIGMVAFLEFDGIAAAHGIARAGWPAMILGVGFLLVPERHVLAAVVLAALALMTLALRLSDLAGAMASAATGALGIVYIFGAWRCASGLRAINPHWLMVALLVSWVGDTAALYVGRAFGRHTLAPRVSPAKTWEGSAGSVAGAMLAAGVYAHYFIAAPLWEVLAIAASANVAGQIGDLAESAFKRGADIKDSGTWLPGHGGWLDRIDSCLFSIPVTYGIFKALDLS